MSDKSITYKEVCADMEKIFESNCKHNWRDITPIDFDGYVWKCRKCGSSVLMSETAHRWFESLTEVPVGVKDEYLTKKGMEIDGDMKVIYSDD